jgi:hypothetical protein
MAKSYPAGRVEITGYPTALRELEHLIRAMKPLASFPLPQLWSDKWPLQRLALYLYPYQPPLQFVACEELTQLALSSCNVWARQKRLKFLDSKSAQCWINQTLVGKICSDFWGHKPLSSARLALWICQTAIESQPRHAPKPC